MEQADEDAVCPLSGVGSEEIDADFDAIRSIVDFEHWHATTTDPINMDNQAEMERWGLVKRKASATHWEEWFISEGLTRKR